MAGDKVETSAGGGTPSLEEVPATAAAVESTTAPAAAAAEKKSGAEGGDSAIVAEENGAAGDQEGGAAGEGEEQEMAVYITVYPPPISPPAAPLVLEPLAGVELVMQVCPSLSLLSFCLDRSPALTALMFWLMGLSGACVLVCMCDVAKSRCGARTIAKARWGKVRVVGGVYVQSRCVMNTC